MDTFQTRQRSGRSILVHGRLEKAGMRDITTVSLEYRGDIQKGVLKNIKSPLEKNNVNSSITCIQ